MIIKVRRERAKLRALRLWHKWFAWYPVRVVQDGKKVRLVWLETVERRMIRTGNLAYPWRMFFRIESSPKDSA